MKYRHLLVGLSVLMAATCGGAEAPSPAQSSAEPAVAVPPPIPEGAVSESFERPAPAQDVAVPAATAPDSSGGYWGVKEGEPVPLIWEDLMPIGAGEALEAEYAAFYDMLNERYAAQEEAGISFETIEEGSEMDYMPQLGSFDTVPELDGMLVRIPGYVVPFEFDLRKRQSVFLFAPYMGACIHTPPPPPNQLIYVEADPAVKIGDMYAAFWLEGTLSATRRDSDLASAAYTLTLTRIEPYGAP